ncbi:phosphoenolpyruvate carboxylase [Candidatus Gottesmanbacteria bacterium]|nr:phosphoenolpyruvate carboxylase [Candidatus Gottesmanbacteria bacterium]
MRKIPATMASQHPDHASKPFWHPKEFISSRSEITELVLTYKELGVDEYKWDWEGKFVDESVVEHLLSEHFDFFKKAPLGKEKFLTFRLPNPKVETEFRLTRAFMVILGSSALAKKVKLHSPPLFEVILPMTESASEMISVQEAFVELTTLKHPLHKLDNDSLKHLEIIPLFEQVDTIIHSDNILRDYLTLSKLQFGKKPKYLRPYVARSDPALNSGIVPTVLAIKIALSRYLDFEKESGIKLYPIIGSASLPFRGGLSPRTAYEFMDLYTGIRTVLLQSAFRYDFKKEDVIKAINLINTQLHTRNTVKITRKDELILRQLIPIFELYYRKTIEGIADNINYIAKFVPQRRERVQHVGLFGYSRGLGRVKLPRAISFTASLYSLGVPPELIGTGRALLAIKKIGSLSILEKYYPQLISDLTKAGKYLNKNNLKKLSSTSSYWQEIQTDIADIERIFKIELRPQAQEEKEHHKLSEKLMHFYTNTKIIPHLIENSAIMRKSLG